MVTNSTDSAQEKCLPRGGEKGTRVWIEDVGSGSSIIYNSSQHKFCVIFCLSGGGMFITTVVLGVVSFISTVTVTSRPFTRDVLFYLGAVAWTFLTLYKEK